MELLIKKPELKALAERIFSGLATEGDLERAKIEDVRAIKCDDGEVRYRALVGDDVELKSGSEERSKRYIASDETVDRMGDIIRVKGWDLKNFLRNPQALWAHNSRALPIGRVTEWEKGDVKGAPALLETITYLEEGVSAEAEAIWKLVNAGVIKAVSVGFLPIKMTWPESPEERESMGLGPYGVLFEKQEQLELSNCTIPANPSCLATRSVRTALRDMITAGQITEVVARKLVELGEKRTIQVAVPQEYEELAETSGTTGASIPTETFVVSGGRLKRVKAAPPPPPIEEMTEVFDMPEDPRIDELLREVRDLRSDIAALKLQVELVVVRGVKEHSNDVRRTLQDAVARVAVRLSEE
jgi:hypothetical protein